MSAVSASVMIGGEATVLSGGGVRPTSNVNIVSIFLKEVSMVEIRLSSVTADITQVCYTFLGSFFVFFWVNNGIGCIRPVKIYVNEVSIRQFNYQLA